MCYPDCFTMDGCNLDQPFDSVADKIGFLEMIEENIALSKRNL